MPPIKRRNTHRQQRRSAIDIVVAAQTERDAWAKTHPQEAHAAYPERYNESGDVIERDRRDPRENHFIPPKK